MPSLSGATGQSVWPGLSRGLPGVGSTAKSFHSAKYDEELPGTPNLASRPLHATPKRLHTIIFGIFDWYSDRSPTPFSQLEFCCARCLASKGISGIPLTRQTRSG